MFEPYVVSWLRCARSERAARMTREKAIIVMAERIATRFRPDKTILFGSEARGEAAPDSDIDLLIVMPECESRKTTTISIMRAVADLPVAKDIVVTTIKELETRGRL